MKFLNVLLLAVALVASSHLFSEPHKKKDGVAIDKEKMSYAFGYDLGLMLYGVEEDIDFEALERGVLDGIRKNKSALDIKQRKALKKQAYYLISSKRSEMMLEESQQFLTHNQTKEDIKVLKSGLQYEVLQEGSGKRPKSDNRVKIHFDARSLTGSYIGNTFSTERPESVIVKESIAGLKEGLQLMAVGSKYRFFIPPDLWDRQVFQTANLAPNDVLIYEVELLDILFNFDAIKR